jgi:hypothetical protein
MTPKQIIERMQGGWTLSNRGKGWWLCEPRIAYRECACAEITDRTVDAMRKDGVITIAMPYNSLHATLTPAAATQGGEVEG